MTDSYCNRLITGLSIREFFHNSFSTAAVNQNLEVKGETIFYIVNLLTKYIRTENFYEKKEHGYADKPLALIYADALEAETTEQQNKILQKLGDITLFIAGLFSYSLNRKSVDVDYYIGMGGAAYSHLADPKQHPLHNHTLSQVFRELSDKFTHLVDILSEISEDAGLSSNTDILRLYEVWLKTGSRRAAKILQQNGIQPILLSEQQQ